MSIFAKLEHLCAAQKHISKNNNNCKQRFNIYITLPGKQSGLNTNTNLNTKHIH